MKDLLLVTYNQVSCRDMAQVRIWSISTHFKDQDNMINLTWFIFCKKSRNIYKKLKILKIMKIIKLVKLVGTILYDFS